MPVFGGKKNKPFNKKGGIPLALVIRLKKTGRKNLKLWRVVVADSRWSGVGRLIEEIGSYNAMVEPPEVKIQKDRYAEWVRKGARPSDTVGVLAKKAK